MKAALREFGRENLRIPHRITAKKPWLSHMEGAKSFISIENIHLPEAWWKDVEEEVNLKQLKMLNEKTEEELKDKKLIVSELKLAQERREIKEKKKNKEEAKK